MEGRKRVKMKTKTENIAGTCVYSTRIESNLRHNIILSFSQSRSQLLLSFWSAPRITNHFRWISVTQALGTGLSFSNVFVWTVENASEPTSVHANRSMRFRWQRKRILSKRISVDRTEIWSFRAKQYKRIKRTWDKCFTYISHLLHKVSEAGSL